MFNFIYYTPTKVVFGKNQIEKLPELLNEFGAKKVLLHYGSNSAKKFGLIDNVKNILSKSGIMTVELGGVVPNPRLSKVYEGIELCKKEKVDFILAIGGGSVIDSSKAIAYGLGEPEYDVWELYEKKRIPKKTYPVATILTIAAAGSEMSDSSVITNEKTGEKRGCNNNLSRLKFAIMDPTYTMTLPDYQTASGCVDIMMHTLERYFTQGGNMEITDLIAESLLRNMMKQATILHKDPENYEARAEVMWCSSISHNGLTGVGANGSDFASHRLEHELGGMYDVTHGAGLAAIWCSWARYVYKDCLDRFVKFAERVFDIKDGDKEKAALLSIRKMEEFFKLIDMPTSIRELGVNLTDVDIEKLARSCEKGVGGKVGTAKVLTYNDFVKIYKMAL